MKLTIPTKPLVSALGKLKSVIQRTTLPILSNVLLTASPGKLRLCATNCDQQMTITLDAEVKETGSATLPCALLYARISRMDGESVSVSIDPKSIATIKSGIKDGKLLGLPAEEFPHVIPNNCEAGFKIGGVQLSTWLKSMTPFMSDEASRYTLCGVYFTTRDKNVVMVATDGRALIEIQSAVAGVADGIVPQGAIASLLAVADAGDISVAFSEGSTYFASDNWSLTTKLIEGIYPNYRQVIPTDQPKGQWFLRREATMDALEYAMSIGSTNIVKLSSDATGITIASEDANTGSSTVILESAGKDVTHQWVCNGGFLISLLRAFDSEIVAMDIIDDRSPHVIRGAGITALLMPIRIN